MRVLVIDDERELREAIARRLRAQGHGVDEAPDGETAESLLVVYEHAVVVLDRMLPDGDAVERLAAWRRRGACRPASARRVICRVAELRVPGSVASARA